MLTAKLPNAGEIAPDFELPDSTGALRRLSDLVSQGPVVLVFFRGHWWPFCLRQLADYRDHYGEIRAAGASVAAVSVDSPEKSETVRSQLRLPFPILCDAQRRVVQQWDIFNPKEKGGIARPAVFIIDRGRGVRYCSIDMTSARVPVSEVVRILQTTQGARPARRKLFLPHPADFIRAIRNAMRLGVRSPHA